MYSYFRVENFRCFEDLEIEPLARVNLIAGRNGVGKTCLLEALWLHLGPDLPDLGLRINDFRGLPLGDPGQLLWSLFKGFSGQSKIHLKAKGDWGKQPRVLHIDLRQREQTEISLGRVPSGQADDQERSTSAAVGSDREVVLEYIEESGRKFTSRGWYTATQIGPGIVRQGMQANQDRVPDRPVAVFLPARYRASPEEDAQRLGQIQVEGMESEVIKVLRHIEPKLNQLKSIPGPDGTIVHGDIGGGRLVPLPLLGDGMSRLLSLAVSFVKARNGAVLVDEIENGLHHTVMSSVWKSLSDLARSFNVQLFATTHSEECIRSAHEAFEGEESYDFRLHRLDRVDGKIRSVTFDREMLDTALDSNLEVR